MKRSLAGYWNYMMLKKKKNLLEKFLMILFSFYRRLKNKFYSSKSKTISKLYLRTEHLRRHVMGWKYSFVTINELIIWTNEWIKTFPTTYDVIVGIPRSGLLVATIIALKLGKPLSTPALFCQDKYWISEAIGKKGECKNILLVDDSSQSAETMKKNLQILYSYRQNLNIIKAALIVTEDTKKLVDLYYKVIPHPRIFEWGLAHSKKGKLVTDLDGVLCENCPGVDSDESLYINWIKTAKPYLIPAFEIDVILSCRLEKYRSVTEEWLAKHRVRYKKLILWDIQSKQERADKYVEYKVEHLLKEKPDIMWESSFFHAKEIWEATKILTLCIDEMILFG